MRLDQQRRWVRLLGETSEPNVTVVVLTDAGEPAVVWSVLNSVLPHSYHQMNIQLLLYDRSGYGLTGPLDSPMPTASEVVNELVLILDNLHITHPIVLIGHGIGCLYARWFARTFAWRLLGVVYLDMVPTPRQAQRLLSPSAYRHWMHSHRWIRAWRVLAASGALRWLSTLLFSRPLRQHPHFPFLREHYCRPRLYDTVRLEIDSAEHSVQALRAAAVSGTLEEFVATRVVYSYPSLPNCPPRDAATVEQMLDHLAADYAPNAQHRCVYEPSRVALGPLSSSESSSSLSALGARIFPALPLVVQAVLDILTDKSEMLVSSLV